jgi:CRISPR-associated endonuclease/helicase Cas3
VLEHDKPKPPSLHIDKDHSGFQASLFIRMLYSCLVDADFLDTEEFMEPSRTKQRGGFPNLAELHNRLDKYLADKTYTQSPMNVVRNQVLRECRNAALQEQGLFSLTVPTGGGKTISSLAFALDHAKRHNLERIVYVIPYTSIIEQNAEVFREALGTDAVIEHHSNFDTNKIHDTDLITRIGVASENWDAPIIVTTNVQFFESLFAHRSSKCRKLHNLARSVVVLDEAQMLPVSLLQPCLAALRELVQNYYTTVVLCTATQPAFSKHQGFPDGLDGVTEIMTDPLALHSSMKRVRISVLSKTVDKVELADIMLRYNKTMCIVNTRAAARQLYEEISKQDPTAKHLSARMCPAHRSKVFDEIRRMLTSDTLCRVVSTQLVEAGVDIDFPTVFREMAGLDSIAQAAGRCNREGNLTLGEMFVFEPKEATSFVFRRAADIAREIIRQHGDDLLSPVPIEKFFRHLYWCAGKELDLKKILARCEEGKAQLEFPFPDIADDFRIIETVMQPVIICWDKCAERCITKLRRGVITRDLIRTLQRYTVQIYKHELAGLDAAGALELIDDTFLVLIQQKLYSDKLGLLVGNNIAWDDKDLII